MASRGESMIISTGMRTDIPAFYTDWFINRIKAGYVYVRNTYNPNQVTKYILNPKVVDCITFCTKNPTPMLAHLDDLSDYRQFWFVTITPYDHSIEPNVPPKDKIIDSFKILSTKIGKNAVGWRYDPVFFGNGYDMDRHTSEFAKIAKELKGYTNFCVISFLDLYKKVRENAPNIYPPTYEEQKKLAKELVNIGRDNGILLRSCCESTHLVQCGVDVAGCQTKEILEYAIGVKLNVPRRKNQRVVCDCLLGNDIGAYDTCGHLCKYCYANSNKQKVLQNMKQHDVHSPLLIGNIQKDDKVTEAKQESYIDMQLTLF